MGFYGHITNIQRTSMTFDTIYPNRFAMDMNATTDGVYAGRYVLVEYTNPLGEIPLPIVVQFNGMLYAVPTAQHDPTSYTVELEPLKIGDKIEGEVIAEVDMQVQCPAVRNLGLQQIGEDEYEVVPMYRKQILAIKPNIGMTCYNLLYNYETNQFQIYKDETGSYTSWKEGCAYTEIIGSSLLDDEVAENNYSINHEIDKHNYGSARGYDSTVWQKTYIRGVASYVMIAELNSVVPTIDVTADAPTLSPMMPHFDKDSTNVYYKLHMQPSWGFRIRAANRFLKVPTLDYSGSTITSGEGYGTISASNNQPVSYPSDETITWINSSLDNNGVCHNKYLSVNDNIGSWSNDKEVTIDGAIFYNKAGFSKEKSNHYEDKRFTDEITLTPTGYSGHLYPTHPTAGVNAHQPDVNELAIILPSIGNTVADMWDLIYGTGDDQKNRNTTIRWEDAKQVHAKEGLRLVRADEGAGGYTYNTEDVNTLAGVINSAQDIIGMIITKEYPVDLEDYEAIERLNEDYIYYQDNKYYYKTRRYEYTPVETVDGQVREPIELEDWEKFKDKVWREDTNNETNPDYIQEDKFYPDNDYVLGANVPTQKHRSREFGANAYVPNKYYTKEDNLIETITKTKYYQYALSSDEKHDVNKRYWDLTMESTRLEANKTYYTPNKFYEGHFVEIEIADETDFRKKINDGIRLFIGPYNTSNKYGLATNVNHDITELTINDYAMAKEMNTTIYYLTLRTCEMTTKEYAATSGANRPILFSTTLGNLNPPQNYYVMEEKYELYEDESSIKASPGVYWYVVMEEGKTKDDYVENGYLKSQYMNSTDLKLEQDIILEPENLYFRKIVKLTLQSADNIVDIKNAKQVTPIDFPDNLYQLITENGIQKYKKIEVTSDVFLNKTDYSTVERLYLLEKITELVIGYKPDTYYYQVTNENDEYYNSIILDTADEPTDGRKYYLPSMINKRQVTEEEIAASRLVGETYYYYNEEDNTYDVYIGDLVAGEEYYVDSLEPAPEFYYPNKYYYKNELGEFILDTSESFTEGREYYKDPQLYILEDPNGYYKTGAIWPLNSDPPEDSGIVLGTREESWRLEELTGFDTDYNTLHGLLLRLNQWMLQNDPHTRDENTLQGALNKLTDLIHRFGSMESGQLMIVDNTGRMHGTNLQTRETFIAKNFGGGAVEVSGVSEATAEDVMYQTINDYTADMIITMSYEFVSEEKQQELDESARSEQNVFGDYYENYEDKIRQEHMADGISREDMWIDVDIDDSYEEPKIFIKHNFTKVKDTTTVSDLNTTQSDTIDLYAPIVDTKGHVVGHNIETVTLPYGYKYVASVNSSSEDFINDTLPPQNARLVAGTTQDSLMIKSANKWINIASNAVDNSLTLAHAPLSGFAVTNDMVDMDDQDKDTIGPVLANVKMDGAGHVIGYDTVRYTVPSNYQIFADENDGITIAETVRDTLIVKGDNWIKPIIEQGSLTLTHINTDGLLPAGFDKIGTQNPAFGGSFNMWAYKLDDNGHCINHQKEAIYLPTDITGLRTPAELDKNYNCIKTNQSLIEALTALDTEISDLGDWAVGAISDASYDLLQKMAEYIHKDEKFTYGEEEMTVADLFAKVKALEDQLNT